MPRLPDDLIEEIRSANDIVSLISEYVPLKRVGRSYKALCPFHQEKTPSFIVNPDRQIYHCFGCGAGGNAVSFVMEQDKISFMEAIEVLAKRAGIPLPRLERDAKRSEENDLLYAANEFASGFYQGALGSQGGKEARDYLVSRGLTPETVQQFRIGFAPPEWDGLLSAGKRKALSPQVLQRAGLLLEREDKSGYYDRFRKRVVFPLFNLTGRVVGFGGRLLAESENEPKYLNSPETPIYQKGKSLYGLYQAKGDIRAQRRGIVVEGYFDLLTPRQAGIVNIVATLGTALTEDQARLLYRYGSEAVLVYDPDTPGAKAAQRGLEVLLEAGFDVRVASLPSGLDPDALVCRRGREAFLEVVEASQDFLDYRLSSLAQALNLSEVSGRSRAVNEILGLLRRVKDELKQRLYVQRIADRFDLEETLLAKLLDRAEKGKTPGRVPPTAPGLAPLEKTQARARLERELLKLMVRDPGFIRKARETIDLEIFEDGVCRASAKILFSTCDSAAPFEPARILNELPDDAPRKFLTELLVQEEAEDTDFGAKAFDGCLSRLQQLQAKNRLRTLMKEIREAAANEDREAVSRLQREYQRLSTFARPSPGRSPVAPNAP